MLPPGADHRAHASPPLEYEPWRQDPAKWPTGMEATSQRLSRAFELLDRRVRARAPFPHSRRVPLGLAHHPQQIPTGDLHQIFVEVAAARELIEQRRVPRHVLEPFGHGRGTVEVAPDPHVVDP